MGVLNMASDRIHIRDLVVECIIGINPEERVTPQQVSINVTMECDLSRGAATDRIEDTVDYKVINKGIIALVRDSKFQLIETMAEKIAETCLGNSDVQSVTVSVDKPGALRHARSVAVEITRGR
jgi:FolB domain-containing protein